MVKSPFSVAVDDIQKSLSPLFKAEGFKKRARTYNRVTEDGLTHVVSFQMGASDPPGTTYHPGLRENLHGLFTVNLGVYVPEVGRWQIGEAKAWVSEPYCAIRARLSKTKGVTDNWWPAINTPEVIDDVSSMLDVGGFPLLERFGTRDGIMSEIRASDDNSPWMMSPPRIVGAIILAERGDFVGARELLDAQRTWAQQAGKTGHAEYVAELANRLLNQ